ncbi:MAG TPA: SDR family oxidoreductase [Solirubrobacteraceae bacterium]|nr:SDR family oxidoreductase [Solirubrobacteraceae bacterium]
MELGLEGRSAVVTATGSGLGLAIARALAGEGVNVTGADIDPSAVEGVAGVTTARVDLLTDEGARQAVEQAVEQHGRIDILVNALGGPAHRPDGFLGADDDGWRRTIDLNFMAMVRTCRAAIPHMQAQGGGSIVSIASDAGRQADPFFFDYCAAKAAVLSLSKSLSIEFAPTIRSNAVSPGPTRTPGLVGFFDKHVAPEWGMSTDAAIEHFVKDVRKLPAGRLGEPEDVANVVLFLASDISRQVTGSEYCVDGGVIQAN